MQRLVFCALLSLAVATQAEATFAGVIAVNGGVYVELGGNIEGSIIAMANIAHADAQQNAASDKFGVVYADSYNEPYNRSAWASSTADNGLIFRTRAEVRNGLADSNGGYARADAAGGEVLLLDFRKSDLIPEQLAGYFLLSGTLSYRLPEEEGANYASASYVWGVDDMGGTGGRADAGYLSSVGSPNESDFIGVFKRFDLTLRISNLWLQADGTVTGDNMGRRPDFGVVGYYEFLRSEASIQGQGTAASRFHESAKLTAMLLADGSTPESHGIDLYFASGRTSPNLASETPEPASIVMLGLGGIGVGLAAWRRRRLS